MRSVRNIICILVCSLLSAVASLSAQQKLNILGLGNSFIEDLLHRVPELFPDDISAINLNYLYISGGSLDDHWDLINNDAPDYWLYHYDNTTSQWERDTATFSQAIQREKWDIFILQQSSQYSGRYPTIQKRLNDVLSWLEKAFPQAEFYWHTTWAYSKDSNHTGFSFYEGNQQYMYHKIIESSYRILEEDYKGRFAGNIPTGIVIQTLRDSTDIVTERDFTRDGYHLDLGIGRYAAACTFHESVLTPHLHHSLLDHDGLPANDSTMTATDADVIRKTSFDIVHNDSLMLQLIANDIIYKSYFYDIDGRLLGSAPGRNPYVRRDLYVSGRKEGTIIIRNEE